MSTNRRALVVLLGILLLLNGCTKVTPPTPLTDIRTVLDRELLYLGMADGAHLVVDPAADNKTYTVGTADAGLFAGLSGFSEIGLAAEPQGGTVFLATVVPAKFRNVPVITAANDKEAVKLYPPALMDHQLFTAYAEFAVESYTIKSTKLVKSTGNAVALEFVVDVKPVTSQFAPVRSRWGTPAADGWIRDKRVTLTIYRNNKQYCAYRTQWQNIFTDGTPPVTQTPPETQYKPVVYEEIWQAIYEGNDVEHVMWEDGTYSYITSTSLSANRQHFVLTVHKIDRTSGARVALGNEILDAAWITALGMRDTVVYAQMGMAVPDSETFSGTIASIDLADGTYTPLLNGQTSVLGTVIDTVYAAQMLWPEDPAVNGIYSLNLTTGALARVSDLPGPMFSTAYDFSLMLRAVGGKLYVLWPDPTAGDVQYALYSIDTGTGAIQQVP